MRELRLAAVGSNQLIAEEIRSITESFLGASFPIQVVALREVKEALPDTFYICDASNAAEMARMVAEENLFAFELHPTSEFFRSISRIPDGEHVYVFNNQRAYAELLVRECRSIGLNKLKFHTVIYGEMTQDEIRSLLKKARYIVGVDQFMGTQTLFSPTYRTSLRGDVQIIAGRRAASAKSAGRLLARFAEYYCTEFGKERDALKKQMKGGRNEVDINGHINRLMAKLILIADILFSAHISVMENQGKSGDAELGFDMTAFAALSGDMAKDMENIERAVSELNFLHQKLQLWEKQ